MKKNSICLILPYFGQFNNYFNLWLLSCKYNTNIDWHIYTDDQSPISFPENVKVHYCTFEDIRKRIINIFGNDIIFNKPYDLCKFKVAYHKIFPEIVLQYNYWGFCDCDLIWGDIYSAIKKAINKKYDKISWRGHFTLFKNTTDINDLFLSEIPGYKTFRDSISLKNEINLFDEVGINYIFDYYQKKIYKDLFFADLAIKSYNFKCKHFSIKQQYKNEHQIFEWNKGKLYRLYVHKDQVHKEEFIYIHLFRRDMLNLIKIKNDHFLIVPNKFIDYKELTTIQIIKLSKQKFYWAYYKKRLKFYHIIKALFQRLKRKDVDIYPYVIQ